MNLKHLIALTFLALFLTSCGGSNSESLADAANLADSIAKADAGGSVVTNSPDLEASFTIKDTLIPVESIGNELFDVFASQELKKLPPKDISFVCDALKESKGNLVIVLNSTDGQSVSFNLSPQQIIRLQRAKHSELNLGAARNQVTTMAERMIPAPEAHSDAVRVKTSVSKSFLEYNIVWAKASSFAKYPQGILTKNYFNALKRQYQAMGNLAEPIITMLEALGIDGVRIVYSAEDSDKELKQAFPWREIRKPIEN